MTGNEVDSKTEPGWYIVLHNNKFHSCILKTNKYWITTDGETKNWPYMVFTLGPRVEDLIRDAEITKGAIAECREVEQIAGKALSYPWYYEDQENFPGQTEKDGVCVGDHVAGTIVNELARNYLLLLVERLLEKLLKEVKNG